MTGRMMSVAANNDAELVSASISGDRDAFGQIVARYQSLVCSLAYSATGSLSQSEDLAQETFVAAWKQLAGLREPEKLRAWLCGIARNLINNWLRRQGREPSHRAESLEEISESHSPEPLPVEQTISNEEQAILWRSLERIPEIYREPLVLFYREHQSIEAVAQNLELTEDAVKQRLSRGRKMLQEQVLAFVEGALERTNPGKAFTLGVRCRVAAAGHNCQSRDCWNRSRQKRHNCEPALARCFKRSSKSSFQSARSFPWAAGSATKWAATPDNRRSNAIRSRGFGAFWSAA